MGFLIFIVGLSYGAKYFAKKYEMIWPLVACAVFWGFLALVLFGSNIFASIPVAFAALWTASQAWRGYQEEGWPWS